MSLLHPILDTVAYGVIILGLLFAGLNVIELKSSLTKSPKKSQNESWPDALHWQVALFLGIAGFVLLIIGVWVH
jgi:hypothetical protein